MRRLPFVRHLPVGKVRYRYVTCRHPVEKPRRHALWLLARTDHPRTPAAVADVVGLSAVTVRAVLHRWQVAVRPETGWRWLVALGFSLRVPRPSHPKAADAPTRRRWKRTCAAGSVG